VAGFSAAMKVMSFLILSLFIGSSVAQARCDESLRNVDLTGEWVGHYTGHFDEFIRIELKGEMWVATKITGDDFVPADEITWRAHKKDGRGEGQISEREFRNHRFVPGQLTVQSRDRIVFAWENCGEVEFRRDD
jgi:hypothetical protein